MAKSLHALIVEDSEDDLLLLLREIRKSGYDVTYERVETPEAMKDALLKEKWDIIISDYVLPQFSGLAALEILKKTNLDLPFIIVSGKIGEDIAVDAMKAGAHDYIKKERLARLIPAIERELREAEIRRERRQALETLETERHWFYSVLEMLPAYLVLLTSDHQVVFANRFFRHRFGDPEGRPCYQYLFGRNESCETCEPFTVLKTKAPHNWEWTGPDNRTYEVYGFPFDETDGSTLILKMGMDITEKKQAEKELRANMSRLEALNQELQEFAFVASHDLQEPLRKIMTFGNMLETKCTDSLGKDGHEYLERMIKSSARMRSLLDALLNYSRVATRAKLFQPTDLVVAAQEAVSDLELVIKRADGRVEVAELATVDADPDQMRQLFQNLIANAVKFRQTEEKPVIGIYGEIDGDTYRVFVKDNGIGFEEEYLDRIFRPFQRLHGRKEYEGTGIGLSICRKIVERHGGTITAKSEPGKGSTFIITLPLR